MPQNLARYPIVPSIVELVTNVSQIPSFSFVSGPLRHYPNTETSYPIRIHFIVNGDIQIPPDATQVFPLHYVQKDTDVILYRHPIIGKIQAKLLMKDLMTTPFIEVNKTYFKFLRFPIGNVSAPGTHLTNIIFLKLLEKNLSPLHSGCVTSKATDGILLIAPPNTGKTTTVFNLVLYEGFELVSEDITVVSEKDAYSCPFTSTYFHSVPVSKELKKLGLLTKVDQFNMIANSILNKFPVLPSIFERPFDPLKLLNTVRSTLQTKISYIFILKKGSSDRVNKINSSHIAREMIDLNRFEFSYYKDPLLLSYGYHHPEYNLWSFMKRECEIISSLANNADCFSIECTNSMDFATKIVSVVG